MIISLIGMSNCGKTRWARRLHNAHGFAHLCCDDMIAMELQKRYPNSYLTDIDSLAAWMGMPYEPGYQVREAAYLVAEEDVLKEVLKQASGVGANNVVIDTTGSVIYLPSTILDELRRVSKVVYLEVGEGQIAQMLERFFAHPKPLVWGKHHHKRDGEQSHEEALRRCYPKLLEWRKDRYRSLAHVTIPYEIRQDSGFDLYEFLLNQQS